jgi:hypothetical protein
MGSGASVNGKSLGRKERSERFASDVLYRP